MKPSWRTIRPTKRVMPRNERRETVVGNTAMERRRNPHSMNPATWTLIAEERVSGKYDKVLS